MLAVPVSKHERRMWTKPRYTVGGHVNWCGQYEKQYSQFLKNIEATTRPSNLISGYIPDINIRILKRYLYSRVPCSIFHNNKEVEDCSYPPGGRWVKKMRHITYNRHSSPCKETEILPFGTTWMNPGHTMPGGEQEVDKGQGASAKWDKTVSEFCAI